MRASNTVAAVAFVIAGGCGRGTAPCAATCPEPAGTLRAVTTLIPDVRVLRGSDVGITVVATATAPARVDSIAFLRDGMRLGVLTGPSGVWTIHEAVLGEYKIRTVVYGTGAVNSPLASAELALLVYTGPTGPTP